MKIPDGPSGHPTLSASSFRQYGAGGFRLTEQEEDRGCPRRWKARYVDRVVDEDPRSYPLVYGTLFHAVMFLMDERGLSPEEALTEAFDPVTMTPEMWEEAEADLAKYMERGAAPMDRYGALAVETELDALLYVDEEFGPIHYRGFIDWLGVDLDDPSTVHLVDYKTNRTPPKQADLEGDVQTRGYAWLVQQAFPGKRVVTHLDVVKFREIETVYDDEAIESWHGWAVAVARTILRDEEALPVLNPGCPHCPVRDSCPLWQALPDAGEALVTEYTRITSPDERIEWRERANRVRLMLEKAVAGIDGEFKGAALQRGEVRAGGFVWRTEPDWKWRVDLRLLHDALGDRFYDAVSTSKTALARVTKTVPPTVLARVQEAVESIPDGVRVVRTKEE